MKKLIKRISEPTPYLDKVKGKVSTVIGVLYVALISSGVIENEMINIVLYMCVIICGGKAVYHAQKIK